jgi:hypothetical protein
MNKKYDQETQRKNLEDLGMEGNDVTMDFKEMGVML